LSALLERTSPAAPDAEFTRLTAGLVPHSFPSHDDAEAAARTLGALYGPVVSQDVLDVNDGCVWESERYPDVESAQRDVGRFGGRTEVTADGTVRRWYLIGGLRERNRGRGVPMLAPTVGLGLAEGRTFRLAVSPGTIGVRTLDATREERRIERERTDPKARMGQLFIRQDGADVLPEIRPARVIAYWSGRSRARMFTTVPQLDLSEWTDVTGDLAMVTLTLPGDWQAVAPTGREFKRAIDRFRKRCERAGLDVRCLWKLEFQGRGAPHWHALMRVPAVVRDDGGYDKTLGYGRIPERYESWVSRTWAECVAADDTWCHRCRLVPGCSSTCGARDTEYRRHLAAGTTVKLSGEQYSDPRRISTYFLGHSSKHTDGKEYQHIVPNEWREDGAGPGRFWGYWGLNKGTVEVDLNQRDWYAVRRMLRHVHRARAWRLEQAAQRRAAYWARRGEAPTRRKRYELRSLGAAGTTSLGGGTVVVNDGIALAYDLARALAIARV
jgi:hypothetical protein